MKKTTLLLIMGCVAVAALAAAVIVLNPFSKNKDPRAAVLLAVANTYAEVKPSAHTLTGLFADIFNHPWRQELLVSINKLSMPLPDPQYAAAAEMLTLKNTTRRDSSSHTLMNTLVVQFAVTPLAELHLYADVNRLAISLPPAFSYYVTADPKQVAKEWDNSLLGVYVQPISGIILEDAFYDYYRLLLTAQAPPPKEMPDYVRHIALLSDAAEYAYEGKSEMLLNSESVACDAYRITIPMAAANDFWREVNPARAYTDGFPKDVLGDYLTAYTHAANQLRFESALNVLIYVWDGKVAAFYTDGYLSSNGGDWEYHIDGKLTGETARLDKTEIRLDLISRASPQTAYTLRLATEAQVSEPELFLSAADITLLAQGSERPLAAFSWRVRWDSSVKSQDNFDLFFNAEDGSGSAVSASANGRLNADRENNLIEANLKPFTAAVKTPEQTAEVSLNVQYLLRGDEGEVVYDTTGETPLTQINELDVLAMLGRLQNDPQWGPLLGEWLQQALF